MRAHHALLIGSFVSLVASGLFAGCSDETGTTTTTTSSSSVSSTAAGTGGEATGGGMGGAGGAGGAGQGGAGGGGGAGPMLLNGCDEAKATDQTGKATVAINKAAGFAYDPPCVKVSKGTDVTFTMNFTAHPLVGGTIINGTPTPDAASPIPATSNGMMATAKFPNEGAYGFYCSMHAPGMAGVVYVVP
jgi:plastocyanin